jgi:DDE superfamily endonuclease
VGVRGTARLGARQEGGVDLGVLAELEAAGLVTLADKGYQGSTYAKIPYKGKNKPQSQKDANKAHAKLRSPGERANAQLKTCSRPGKS